MRSDDPHLRETEDGFAIQYRGRHLYAPARPRTAAKRRAEAITLLPETLYLVPSPLLFYGIDSILEHLPLSSHLLCVEVDQTLMRMSLELAALQTGISLSDKRLTFLRTDSPDAAAAAARSLGAQRYRRVREIIVNGARSLSTETYDRILDSVTVEVQSQWRNKMTIVHMGHLWIKNIFRNVPRLVGSSYLSAVHLENLPVLVLGAGESLERAVRVMRKYKGRVFVVAVDTAVSALRDFDFEPNLIVVLESQSLNLEDFVGVDIANAAVAADLTSYPACSRRFDPQRRYYFLSGFMDLPLFHRMDEAQCLPLMLPPLGSVGVTAAALALRLTDGPVFCAGLDFTFRAGKPHARGCPSHRIELGRSDRLEPSPLFAAFASRPHRHVTDVSGNVTFTDATLQSYVEGLIALAAGSSRFFDIRDTGLPLGAVARPSAGELETAMTTVSGSGTSGHHRPRAFAPGVTGQRRKKINAFLQGEIELLGEFRRSASRLIRHRAFRRDSRDAVRYEQSLLAVSYVNAHFPDDPGTSELGEGYVKRTIEAADTCASWIEQSIAALRDSGS